MIAYRGGGISLGLRIARVNLEEADVTGPLEIGRSRRHSGRNLGRYYHSRRMRPRRV